MDEPATLEETGSTGEKSNASDSGSDRKHDDQNSLRICFVGETGKDEEAVEAGHKFASAVVFSETGLELVEDRTFENVFVVEDFFSPTFDSIHEKRQRILGRPALKQLVARDMKLPPNGRPLFSLALLGNVVCFTGFRRKEQVARLMTLTHHAGGSVRQDMVSKVTHLVANGVGGGKYQYAVAFRVPVVAESWILDSWENSQTAPESEHRIRPFCGARVSFRGFSDAERVHMAHVLAENGGTEAGVGQGCTHIVVDSADTYSTLVRCAPPTRSSTPLARRSLAGRTPLGHALDRSLVDRTPLGHTPDRLLVGDRAITPTTRTPLAGNDPHCSLSETAADSAHFATPRGKMTPRHLSLDMFATPTVHETPTIHETADEALMDESCTPYKLHSEKDESFTPYKLHNEKKDVCCTPSNPQNESITNGSCTRYKAESTLADDDSCVPRKLPKLQRAAMFHDFDESFTAEGCTPFKHDLATSDSLTPIGCWKLKTEDAPPLAESSESCTPIGCWKRPMTEALEDSAPPLAESSESCTPIGCWKRPKTEAPEDSAPPLAERSEISTPIGCLKATPPDSGQSCGLLTPGRRLSLRRDPLRKCEALSQVRRLRLSMRVFGRGKHNKETKEGVETSKEGGAPSGEGVVAKETGKEGEVASREAAKETVVAMKTKRGGGTSSKVGVADGRVGMETEVGVADAKEEPPTPVLDDLASNDLACEDPGTGLGTGTARAPYIVRAEWFWVSVQNEGCADEKDYLFEDRGAETLLSPRSELGSARARKRKRLRDAARCSQSPANRHKRRSSVSDANLLSVSGSFLDSTGNQSHTDEVEAPLTARHLVFLELVQTEANYVSILSTIMSMFKGSLEDMTPSEGPLLNATELRLIFGNLPPIFELHSEMLDELRAAALSWREDVGIGHILNRYMSDMGRAYPPFVNFFEASREALARCDADKPRFHAFLKVCQTRPECGRQSLAELLIRPVQRLPSIGLLLNDLLKRTAPSNPDHDSLERALQGIKEVMTHINEDKRKTESQLAMFDIFHEIDNCPPELLSSHRCLVTRVEATELAGGVANRGDSLALFLFTDVLEVCKVRGKVSSPRPNAVAGGNRSGAYKHVRLVPLSNVKRVVDVRETPACRRALALVVRGGGELKERTWALSLSTCAGDKTSFLRLLCRQLANAVCKPDAESFLVTLDAGQLDVSLADPVSTLGKAFKFASRTRLKVGRAFSFNKTPSKLKRAVSTAMASPFAAPSRQQLTPASQLAQMRLASCSNLHELASPKPEAPMSVQPTRRHIPGSQSLNAATLRRL